VLWGASPLARDYTSIWPTRADAHTSVQQAAIDLVPKDAAVSAPYNLVPHLTHRSKVYEFPVPWCNINWGVAGIGAALGAFGLMLLFSVVYYGGRHNRRGRLAAT